MFYTKRGGSSLLYDRYEDAGSFSLQKRVYPRGSDEEFLAVIMTSLEVSVDKEARGQEKDTRQKTKELSDRV